MSSGSAVTRGKDVLVDVHDDAANALRTTITNADVDINVSAFTDSIKIGDGTGQTATITDLGGGVKALDVNIADIAISHTSDSVRLGDGTDLVTTTNIGAKQGLDVNLLNAVTTTPAPAGVTKLNYGNITGLAIAATNYVVQYTVPGGITRYLQRIYLSGTQIGTFYVKINGATILKSRLSPTQFTQVVDFATGSAYGIYLTSGNTVDIEVTNEGTGLGDFDSTLQFMEV